MLKISYLIVFFCALFCLGCGASVSNNGDSSQVTTEESANENIEEIQGPEYEQYCNENFDFCVSYPMAALTPLGEYPNGDGQIFESENGQISLSVYIDKRMAMDPNLELTFKGLFEQDCARKDLTVSQKSFTESSYEISGTENGNPFYQKTIMKEAGPITCLFVGEAKEKEFIQFNWPSIKESFK
ncbi:MAG: hypothetical protein EAZ57_04855 [Cytophagales bacterium]|nr:MAG: hypothetical protein EAZ67_01025 [Cytophagales bacterium]TAF61122.1 MAG: hypothetical protein EAZ57_04855 [Cytophagales bacterium]